MSFPPTPIGCWPRATFRVQQEYIVHTVHSSTMGPAAAIITSDADDDTSDSIVNVMDPVVESFGVNILFVIS